MEDDFGDEDTPSSRTRQKTRQGTALISMALTEAGASEVVMLEDSADEAVLDADAEPPLLEAVDHPFTFSCSRSSGSGHSVVHRPSNVSQRPKKKKNGTSVERQHQSLLSQLTVRELLVFSAVIENRPLPDLPKTENDQKVTKKYTKSKKRKAADEAENSETAEAEAAAAAVERETWPPDYDNGGHLSMQSYYVSPHLHQETYVPTPSQMAASFFVPMSFPPSTGYSQQQHSFVGFD